MEKPSLAPPELPDDRAIGKALPMMTFDEMGELDQAVEKYIRENPEKLGKLRRRVSVVTPGGPDATFTQIMSIQVDWQEEVDGMSSEKTREEAAEACYELTGNILRAYLARYRRLNSLRIDKAGDVLDKGLQIAKEELRKAVDALSKLSEELGQDQVTVASIVGKQGIESGPAIQVSRLETRIHTVDSRLAELGALEEALSGELQKQPAAMAVPDEVIQTNAVVSMLQQRVTDLKLQLNNLRSQYTDEYREVQTLESELTDAYADLRNEMQLQLSRVRTSIAMNQAQKKYLQTQLDTFQQRMKTLGPKAIEWDAAMQEVEAAQATVDQERERHIDAMRAKGLAENPVLLTVVDEPNHPNPADPRRPILWLNILIACVAGAVLALIYAFVADHFDHTIKSIDDSERYLGVPVVASVPKLGRGIIQTP
jgi:chromosome segregation ATPase